MKWQILFYSDKVEEETFHSFIKKTRKTPKRELKVALTRKKDIENGK